jgi:hypothetical protein
MHYEMLKQFEFDLSYLIMLTSEGLKPSSRWEKAVPQGLEQAIEEQSLQTAYVRRKLQNGNTTTELIFSPSETYPELYLRRFDNTLIDKSIETQRFEGFLFGFPPCCVESFAAAGYQTNEIDAEDQRLLFHWACPHCQISPLLVPEYRRIYRQCQYLLAGNSSAISLFSENTKTTAKGALAVVTTLALAATGVALFLPAKANAAPLGNGDPHWLSLAQSDDSDQDLLMNTEEPYLGLQPNNPDTDGNGLLDGVQLAQAMHLLYSALPHKVQNDQPYIIDHLLRGIENCTVCDSSVNMGYCEIVNPLEKQVIELPYISLHYLLHGSFQYAGTVHGEGRVNPRQLKAVLEADGTWHRLKLAAGSDKDDDGLYDNDEPHLGTDPYLTDTDQDGIIDGIQLSRAFAALIDSLPREPKTDSVYVEEHAAKGVESCAQCGESVNMGYLRIINPMESQWTELPFLALHYMRCGGFSYDGDVHKGMANARILDMVIHPQGTSHLLEVADDQDKDGLKTDEESYFSADTNMPDSNDNGLLDGIELGLQLAAEIDSLPREAQINAPYLIEHYMWGLENCEVCGQAVNMGYVEITSPINGDTLITPIIGLHAMNHGSFSYDGSLHDGRVDPIRLAKILHAHPTSMPTAQTHSEPIEFALWPNYPNPFNSSTVIRYDLPAPAFVTLGIYNLQGQKVRSLVSENRPAGAFTSPWDGRDDAGKNLSSGIYYYRLQAGSFSTVRRMILLQ